MDALVASVIFALVFIVTLVVLTSGGRDKEQTTEIMRRIARPDEAGQDEILRGDRRGRYDQRWLKVLYRLNLLRKLEERMWQAGIYMEEAKMLLIIVLMLGAGAAIGKLFWHDMLFTISSGLLCAALPLFYINFRRQRRLRAFSRQLPFALDLMKSSLEAGHSLSRGLQVLVQEFGPPLGTEFRTALEQVRLGLPLPRALGDMLKRVPEEDLRLFAVAVKVQAEVGSSLAQIIGRLSEIVRARQRLQAQIRAMTAQSRMGGTIVGLLPVVVLAAFSLVQPSYTMMLFHDPTGVRILKAAIVLDALAFATIRRIIRVRY
jgi:tight adherence protein B